jgi:hypothetical protein
MREIFFTSTPPNGASSDLPTRGRYANEGADLLGNALYAEKSRGFSP